MDLDGRPIETPSSPQPQAPAAALQAPTPIPFIDTHMHLDMSLSRHHISSLDELEQRFRTGNLELVAVVANYVFSRLVGNCVVPEISFYFYKEGNHVVHAHK